MSQFFYIHPDNPQQRLINQAVEIVRKGGVIVYPTDSGYALGCKIEDKNAMERICRIRQLPDGHNFTLMCRDLSELSTYSFVDNVAFRLMKNNTPGNFTFILKGTKEVPRRLLQEKRKTIGKFDELKDKLPSLSAENAKEGWQLMNNIATTEAQIAQFLNALNK